ncbi:surface lipoprotein assembly modifier [Actinobacillus genomosp. 2]|nr:surface lipoprotein assembly modifier [Actinobacillus genomosp. 2]WGE32797.1 surface lipoprotein assembly modifier [Actinobacillus genomosp. 2]
MITSKLSYSYKKVNSNLANLYSYKYDLFYLNFEKTF